MQRVFAPLPSFTGAALGTQPTCTPDILGRSIDTIMLRVIGTAEVGASPNVLSFAKVVSMVEVLINGRVKSVYHPHEHYDYLATFNATSDPYPLDCFFVPFARRGIPNSEMGTAGLESVQIRCTLVDTLPTGLVTNATFTRLEGTMVYFLENAPRDEAFVNTVVTPVTPGVGENIINRLETGNLARIRNLYITCPTAPNGTKNTAAQAISKVSVRVGDLDVFTMNKATVKALLAYHPLYKDNPTTYGFFVPLDLNNEAGDFQTVRVNDVPLPVQVTYEWDAGTTPQPVRILIEGTEGVKLVPKAA